VTSGAPGSIGRGAARHVFRWDLDKTYLRTEFDSLGDLLKSAIETAADKKAYPGATALLRTLSTGDGYRVCIISGSPTQMRAVLAAKLALDGVAYDEFVLKNNVRNILRGRFRSLRAQIPYKLPALLASRGGSLPAPAETLFGDDAEADAIVYCLYADLLAGRVDQSTLVRILESARAYPDEIERTLGLARTAPHGDAVKRIVIHLDRKSPPMGFRKFGPRLVPVFNYFQAALVLYADSVIDALQVMYIAIEMLDSRQYQLATLANSLQDLMRRNRLAGAVVLQLADELQTLTQNGGLPSRPDLPSFAVVARAFSDRVRELGGAAPLPWPADPDPLDYVSLVDQEHHNRRDQRRRGARP
jgi:hypothetical protein